MRVEKRGIPRDRSRDLAFRTKYGIDFTDYKRLAETQANACAICGEPETAARNGKLRWLAVDHCHDTGRVRSLLCGRCNPMIGFADHSTDILTCAIDYLRRTNRQGPKAAKKPKKAITQKERLNKPAAYRRLIEKGLEAEAKGKLKRRGHD